jgi:type VI secretion system secreted protein Hcp
MAYDAYLFIKGVVGESTAKIDPKPAGMTDAPMDIFSFSFGASNPVTVGSNTAGMGGGKVSISSLSIMKKSDDASPVLFQACCTGQHYTDAVIILRKAAGTAKKQMTFIEYVLKEVYIESIQWSGSSGGDDTPTESISLAFAEIQITNHKQQADGSLVKGKGASWNLKQVDQAAGAA